MFSSSLCVFKQKTADELRISDWSSDVCSSDLARLNCLQLLGIADENNFRPLLLRFRHDALKLAGTDHPGLVDHKDMLVGQPFTIIGPLMFETGERPRTNARALFEPLRGNTRQRSALPLIPRALPRLARHAAHRPLARAGIADDIARSEEHTSE